MNNRATICHSTTYEKPQKMRYFRPENFSFVLMALIWGQNSNLRPAEFAIRKHRDGAVVMSTSKRTIKNCLPLNWRHGRLQANKKPELSQALAY